MKVLDFAQYAPGLKVRGTGFLYFAIHEKYLEAKTIQTRVHTTREITQYNGEKHQVAVSGNIVNNKTLYNYNSLKGRYIIAVEAILTDLAVKLSGVEFIIYDQNDYVIETLFIIKRSGTYTNPYKPDMKIQTTAEVTCLDDPEEEQQQFSSNRDCNDLINEILKASKEKNVPVSDTVTVKEMDLEPSAPYILLPKDKETPLVPFWFSHDQWRYFDKKFAIEDGKLIMSRYEMDSVTQRIHSLFLQAYSGQSILLPPTTVTQQEVEDEIDEEQLTALIDYINTTNLKLMMSLPPTDVKTEYFRVDKGKMYACVSLKGGLKRPRDYIMLRHEAFVSRYRIFSSIFGGYGSMGQNSSMKFYLKRGEVVGFEVDGELKHGERAVESEVYNEYMKTIKNMQEQFKFLETLSEDQEEKIKTVLSTMGADALFDIPYSMEFGEELEVRIKHPLLYGTLMTRIDNLGQDEERVMTLPLLESAVFVI